MGREEEPTNTADSVTVTEPDRREGSTENLALSNKALLPPNPARDWRSSVKASKTVTVAAVLR
jgi:hypothetical protein